jgi:hypothetical protein
MQAYSEQVGVNRQARGSSGDIQRLYPLKRLTRHRLGRLMVSASVGAQEVDAGLLSVVERVLPLQMA